MYRAPLGAFVEARAALARSLTGDDARRVRKLAKPTVVPWAVNQVYWRARPLFDRLLKSGALLRDAQVASLEGKRADVRAALDAHRRAIAEAVKTAEQIAAADGLHPSADALLRTLETLSLTPATSAPLEKADAPGRLTKPLLPVGFAALSGVKIAAPAEDDREDRQKNVQTAKTDKKKAAEDARRRSAEAAAQKLHKAKVAKVKKAEAALERARRQMAEAQAALKRATDGS